MARLRAPDGCPWDREQTFETIKPFLLEETYEVLDAIDARDWQELPDELGDLLLQAVFFSQMADEQGLFRIDDALDRINEKLVRRHPHVFGDAEARTEGDVRRIWGEIKDGEKREKGVLPGALLDGVPRALPALVEAAQISAKAARTGFDWNHPDEVIAKLHEELEELRLAETAEEREDELGDLLFVIVNLARWLKVDPEQALRKTNAKFRARFGHVEARLKAEDRSIESATLEEMEALWQEAKRNYRL